MKKIKVAHSNGELEDFKPRMVREQLQKETNLTDEDIEKITETVIRRIKKHGLDEVYTSTIRAIITSQMLERGFLSEISKVEKMGMSVNAYENLIKEGNKDNANIQYSHELINKYASDSIAKDYALRTMPTKCADAHKRGYVHHHDLEFFNARPNCFNMDASFFARNGLRIDGKGDVGSVTDSPKSLEVFCNQLLQAMMACATVFSGGIGIANFNTFLSPFARGRSYEDIKQCMQGFWYNANCSLVCRGGQVLFSSVGLDMSVPSELADKEAISFGGVPIGVYGDYQEEADLIFRACCEVIGEGDAEGNYHRFPNTLFNIREGDLDNYNGNCRLLHELGANNPTIYYVNCTDIERTVMGCRTALPMNYAGDYQKDCLNTGNFMYTTLNLPLIALESESELEFYEELDYYCEIVYETLKFRRSEVEKAMYENHMHDFLLQKDKITGEQLYELDRTTYTIGFCGLNECLVALYGKDILEVEDKGVEIIEFINKKKDEFFERDGLRWSVIASPSESTSGRFARIIKNKHPQAFVQGTEDSYYLTNSSHIPVNAEANIGEHIQNADKFHGLKMTGGGNLLHIWLGEVWSDSEALWKLNQKILETNTTFWAYSKVFTFCRECQYTINDYLEECPICKSKDLRSYDRITGYYIPIDNYGKPKAKEQKERYRQSL